MGRPAGSKNKPKPFAQNIPTAQVVGSERFDSYVEAFTGMGTRNDRTAFTRIKAISMMTEQELSSVYLMDGFARRIVDIPAEEMTRAGFKMEGIDEAQQRSIFVRVEELGLMQKVNEALCWSRLFGGAVLILGINDGGGLDMPLNIDNVRSVEFIRVADRHRAHVFSRYADPMMQNYDQPEMWQITPAHGGNPYYVHESRIQVFDGEPLPERERAANLGWGASVIQACSAQLTRLGTSHQWANMLLERSQQAIHSIPGLASMLQDKAGERHVANRVQVVDMVRGILNTIIIDGEETYNVAALGISSGVNELLDRFAEALSAVSGIPVYLLMGRSPGGLNATGDANQKAWHARIAAMQRDALLKPLDGIVSLIAASLNIEKADNYQLLFNPLEVMSAKESAEIEKLEEEACKYAMETMKGYVEIGSLDPNEVRRRIAEKYEVTGTIEPPLVENETD